MGLVSFVVRFGHGPFQGQTMVHWLWRVVFLVVTNLHPFSNALGLLVSTGSIRWILWFSVRYAAAAARREIFGVNALRGKQQQLGSPNLQDIFIRG